MRTECLKLAAADKAYLKKLLSKGSLTVKTFKRATALLEIDRGKTRVDVAESLDVSYAGCIQLVPCIYEDRRANAARRAQKWSAH